MQLEHHILKCQDMKHVYVADDLDRGGSGLGLHMETH